MKDELKQLSDFLLRNELVKRSFLPPKIEKIVLYLFLRRYDAIKTDLNLPDFKYDIKKYQSKDGEEFYPHDDIFKPFYSFIQSSLKVINAEVLDRIFNDDGNLSGYQSEEILNLENEIERIGILDFSIETFTISEFDDFFMELIYSLKLDRESIKISKEFSGLINDVLKTSKKELYIGDTTSQILFDRVNYKGKKIIGGSGDSKLWYYLRILLSGKKNIDVDYGLTTIILNKPFDYIFAIPSVGKIEKRLFDGLKGGDKVNITYRYWELFYSELALKGLKKDGKAILILPSNTLVRTTRAFQRFRKRIVESEKLKTIIRLPKGIFGLFNRLEYSLIELDNSWNKNYIKYINSVEIEPFLYSRERKKNQVFFEELRSFWKNDSNSYPFVNQVKISDIREKNYSLGFANYFNVNVNTDSHKRYDEEKLISFNEILQKSEQGTTKVSEKVPYVNISHLSESFTKFRINVEDLPKSGKGKRLKKLNSSAILIGKIVGSIKPSVIEVNEKSVYLEPKVIAYEIPNSLNLEYLILELRSDFVQQQFKAIASGQTIPSIRESELHNVFLRVLPLPKQLEIVKDEYSTIAKSKLEEVEGLSADIKFIEKEVFASFAHNFKQILHKVALDIDTLKNYMTGLQEKDIINFGSSILFEEKAPAGQSVGEVLTRLVSNQNKAEDFLQNEVAYFTQDQGKYYTIVNIKDVTLNWKKRQICNNYKIVFRDSVFGNLDSDFDDHLPDYIAKTNESDLVSILNNLLKNAVEHGFQRDKDNEFVICFTTESREGSPIPTPVMHVGNNGIPFPNDFTCNDLFKLHHKGNKSSGSGLGGYSIKRKLDRMGATIKCKSSILPKNDFPIQFEIHFKPVEFEDFDE